jgi:predicted permease
VLLSELRHAFRALRRAPAFALTGIGTLAAAAATLTTTLAVVKGVLLDPLPVVQQDQIVVAWKHDLASGFAHFPFSYPAVHAMQGQLTTISGLATVDYNGAYQLATVEGDRGTRLQAGIISGNLMPLLGIVPTLGRTLLPSDDVVGAAPVTVISEGLWRSRYGADTAVTRKAIRLHGKNYQIVGVVPGEFGLPAGAVMWLAYQEYYPEALTHEDWVLADLIVRLKPGRTVEQFRSELEALRKRLAPEARPGWDTHRIVAQPLRDVVSGEAAPTLWLLAAGAILVLVVAGVNLGGLLLVRAGGRIHEMAVRAAIGGGGWAAVRTVQLEYWVVVVAGATLGVSLGAGVLRIILPLLPAELPGPGSFGLDALTAVSVLLACVIISGIAVICPMLALSRAQLTRSLQAGARAAAGWRVHPLRRGMVALQMALAVLVVTGAGLLLRTLERLHRIEPGFRPEGVLFLELTDSRPYTGLDLPRARNEIDRIIERLARVPGVTSTGAVLSPPFVGNAGFYMKLAADDMTTQEARDVPYANVDVVVPATFSTLGITRRRGRLLEASDRESAQLVTVINETLARRLWRGEDPVGRRLRVVESPGAERALVVGVVADTRYNELKQAAPMAYLSYRQSPWAPSSYYLVRIDKRAMPETLVPLLRTAVQAAEPGLAITAVTPLSTILARPLARPRLAAVLVSTFGLMVLSLAALGIYGVMASFVVQRTREIGVRLALGATGTIVRRLVFRQGMVLALIGSVAGLLLAGAGSRYLASLLYEVMPVDPITFCATLVMSILVATVAILIPAARAARLEPIVALRAD